MTTADQRSTINGYARTVRDLLSNRRYGLEFYQREYSWERTQVEELLTDLTSRFGDQRHPSHTRKSVATYRPYFLGPIITSQRDGTDYLIDGQQRLTSLSLLLIHLLHRLVGHEEIQALIRPCISSVKYGEHSFTLDVPDREPVMNALVDAADFDREAATASVRQIWGRYQDIERLLELSEDELPLFVDWLLEKVILVEITTSESQMAYEIFETMNDRGLNLTPTDMLKSYLLARMEDLDLIRVSEHFWRQRIQVLGEAERNADAEFFKAWLRAHYAQSIRERKKQASPRDFDIIGTAFHRWVRDNEEKVDLKAPSDFHRLVNTDMRRMSHHYLRLLDAESRLTPGLEHVRYNAETGFTLQLTVALAPVTPEDDDVTANAKMEMVARYLDTFVARRIVNYRNFGYSTVQYTMFNLAKEIRGLDLLALRDTLLEQLEKDEESFGGVAEFGLHMQNGRRVRYLLARLTDFVERQCKGEPIFEQLIDRSRKHPFEIEHIWADKYDRYAEEFPSTHDFQAARNRLGGLLLVPKDFNGSYGALPYEEKVRHYRAQNLLAASLHPDTYERNPSFVRFLDRTGLPFQPYPERFGDADMRERQELYRQLCELIWSLASFHSGADLAADGGA